MHFLDWFDEFKLCQWFVFTIPLYKRQVEFLTVVNGSVLFRLFNHLARHNINVDMILQSVGREGTKDISFTVAVDNAD